MHRSIEGTFFKLNIVTLALNIGVHAPRPGGHVARPEKVKEELEAFAHGLEHDRVRVPLGRQLLKVGPRALQREGLRDEVRPLRRGLHGKLGDGRGVAARARGGSLRRGLRLGLGWQRHMERNRTGEQRNLGPELVLFLFDWLFICLFCFVVVFCS
jgi:hypothetical protein